MRDHHFSHILVVIVCLSGCAGLPNQIERRQTRAFTDTAHAYLGHYVTNRAADHPDLSGFHLLANGLDAFAARAVLADLAERSIYVQYYLYHNDQVGRLFTYQLVKAADRGVRVRHLVDDMDLGGRDLSVAAMDSHPNIELRIFNPFSRKTARFSQYVSRMGSVTRRMHNKSFTVDNQMSILGGRNIGNEYFDADPDLSFTDLDVLAIGPVANDVSNVLDLFWNSELAYPATVLLDTSPTQEQANQMRQELDAFVAQQSDSAYLQAMRTSSLADAIREDGVACEWGDAVIVYDHPEKLVHESKHPAYYLGPQLAPYFKAVEYELIIISPYFVPGKSGTAFLTNLAKRGVRVRILTNSLASNDVGIVHAGYSKYRKDLLRAGVELYELNKKMTRAQRQKKKGHGGSSKAGLHAKSFVFDREQVFFGSLNLDPRAVIHNTEIGVVMTSEPIANEMGRLFDSFVKQAAFRLELVKDASGSERMLWHGQVDDETKNFTVEPYTGFWRRLGIGFMRLLPIESQL